MTGFRSATRRPEKVEENGDRIGGPTRLGAGRALSREPKGELHSDSEYADRVSGRLVSQEETTVLNTGDRRTSFEGYGHGLNDGAHGRPDLSGEFDLARVGITWD